MSNVSESVEKIGKLVCDAVPDPPRIFNNSSDEHNSSEDQTNETEPNISHINGNYSSTSKKKSKKKSKMTSDTTINYNIINSANIKIGPTTKHVFNLNNYQDRSCASANKIQKEEIKEMHPNVQALSKSQSEITKEDMFLIKTHIGNGWKDVAKKIGFSKGQIEQFLENHKHKGIDEVVYRILVDWKQSCTKDAMIGRLVNAMWSSREYDCVEKLVVAHNLQ